MTFQLVKMPPKKTKPTQLTPLARIYSHPTGSQHADLEVGAFLKSGLTPTFASNFAKGKEQKAYKDLVIYQRWRFRGTFQILKFGCMEGC